MAVTAWPAADRAAWEGAAAAGDDLDAVADIGWMADNTRRSLITAYAWWLVWLKAEHPDSLAWPPGDRVRKDWVLAFLDGLRGRLKLSTTFTYGCALRSMLRIVAPADARRWLDPLIDNLERRVQRQPRTPKAFVEVGQLYDFGLRMMQTAGAELDQPDVAVAEQFRDGLIFALLAMRPLRRSNMVGIRIGHELIASGQGYRVVFPPEVYKTNEAFEFAVPDQLVSYLRLYVEAHRPVLAAGGSGKRGAHLWLFRTGSPLTGDSLRKLIRSRSEQEFGVALNPHDFRHCAASCIAEASPDEFPIIKNVLGHSTLQTSERHYVHAKGMAVARSYQDIIEQRRKQAARSLGADRNKPSMTP
jgi:integrase